MVAVTFFFFLLAAAFFKNCAAVYGWPAGSLGGSAAVGWRGQNSNMGIFWSYLFGVPAALLYGDALVTDRKTGGLPCLAGKITGKAYLYAGALTAFLSAFAVYFVFFLISQLLAFFVYPASSSFIGASSSRGPAYMDSVLAVPLFPKLMFHFPYLNNLVYMVSASVWAGVFGLASYLLSLAACSRLVSLFLPQLLLFFSSFLLTKFDLSRYILDFYLYPQASLETSAAFFFFAPLIALALAGILLAVLVRLKRESLFYAKGKKHS